MEDILPLSNLDTLRESINKEEAIVISGVANKSAKSFLFSKLFSGDKKNTKPKRFLWVCGNNNEAMDLYHTLDFFIDNKYFDIKKFSNLEQLRINKIEWVLSLQKQAKKNEIFIITQKDLEEKFPDPIKIEKEKLTLCKGEKINTLQVFNDLIESGFEVSADIILKRGQYRRSGNVLDIFPINFKNPIKVEVEFDEISNIYEFLFENKKTIKELKKVDIYPLNSSYSDEPFYQFFSKEDILIFDDIEDFSEFYIERDKNVKSKMISFTPFPEHEDKQNIHLNYLSVLKFFTIFDLIADLKEKIINNWNIAILTKRVEEIENIFTEEKVKFSKEKNLNNTGITLINAKELEHIPSSFQNQNKKLLFLTDREIFQLRKGRKIKAIESGNLEFLTSLKPGDFVVHADHGIGRFLGITEKEIDKIKREFLEIAYAENDKLFVPVDQADKISRFITTEGSEPRLTRLGGVEWKQVQKKVKKETEKIAKELLKIQAYRMKAKGHVFNEDTERQKEFEKTFPYEETPGQMQAIMDVKKDMEKSQPADRLICGDVGFGKTEVAMRAAFKAVENQKQVALISPITILADQHYHSFKKRMDQFDVRIEMLSRFRSQAEQKVILNDLAKGKIDIIIGTHRLLQNDIKFFNLGLLVIDEEQRFGVKQKEKLKKLRSEVDIVTLSATPIPRTLNLALHKLRDITTITTPPPGRLPVSTEIRKYSDNLIREAILREVNRDGQIFFLHNRVETIEAISHKLKVLIPEAKFIVAHGQMKPEELERRIVAFKEKKYDVLISSTIIENGIDLPNANTLIVNKAEMFGLAQLYQLRGRIGRGRTQAYAYFLYHTQKLKPEAKKRLRAIVEASELGSGFQIAMKDLEIRGAGDVLGVNQHGTVNSVGVHHFLRLLNETIKQIKIGKEEDTESERDVLIEIPIDSYIPSNFIADQKEKILAYQQLSAIKTFDGLQEIIKDLEEEFGKPPKEVKNLYRILEIKLHAKIAGLKAVRSVAVGQEGREIHLHLSKKITALEIMNLLQYNEKWMISGDVLKINVKYLGFNWIEELIKSVEKLKKDPNSHGLKVSDQMNAAKTEQ